MFTRSILLGCLMIGFATAQTTPKTTTPKTPTKTPKKDNSPPGYKKSDLRGFTLYISDEALAENDKSTLKRTPLEALERELIIVETVIPADKIKAIKAVPIWVEWNETLAMSNGRAGAALAVFSGGFQENVFAEAKKEVKGKSVTILRLRSLALEHQPDTDSGRCVTLHELAHAFHHFTVGDENPLVKNTYKQAMERKLYDPKLYVATNEHEYFAELTCAYLDRMDAYPRNREELKKHDPKAFEMMEKLWGRIIEKKDTTAKGPKLPSKDGDGKFPLNVKRNNLSFGKAVIGELPKAEYWAGKPLLVIVFSPNDKRTMQTFQKLNSLYNEMKDFGLQVVAGYQLLAQPEDIRAFFGSRDIDFPICPDADIGPTPGGFLLPHAILFDAEGKNIFRGDPLDAEMYARLEINNAILKKLNKDTWLPGVKPVITLLEQGAPIPAVLTKLNAISESLGSDAKAEWVQVRDVLIEDAKRQVAAAEGIMKDDPVGAWLALEKIAAFYKSTPAAKSANDLILKLRANPKVALEVRARLALEPIKKLDTQLAGKEMSFDPRQPDFRFDNSALIRQIGDAVEKMKRTYPDAKATNDALKIARHWLIKIK